MAEHMNEKCRLGFNEERILVDKKQVKRLEKIVANPVPYQINPKDGTIGCIYKPRLSKSDREDLGYYYKKGRLYNLHHAEVPVCIFCNHYK